MPHDIVFFLAPDDEAAAATRLVQEGLAQLGYELFMRRFRDGHAGPAPLYDRCGSLLPSGSAPCLVTVLRLAAHQGARHGTGAVMGRWPDPGTPTEPRPSPEPSPTTGPEPAP